MYSREVSFVNRTSRLDLRAPDLQQSFPTLPRPSDRDDRDGDDGKHGVDGPIGRVVSWKPAGGSPHTKVKNKINK